MLPTDTDLIQQSIQGDFIAFEQLVYRYDREVLTLAARYTQSSEDAKDIYQEVFLRVYKGLAKFEGKSEFATWLYRIATNVCLTYKSRKKKAIEISLNEDDVAVDVVDEQAEKFGTVSDVNDRIQDALKKLSPNQKMVFTLRHFQEHKIKDIARMMNCAEGTVKKYLFEATQKMRTHLKDLYE